jgi:hypothetical protein
MAERKMNPSIRRWAMAMHAAMQMYRREGRPTKGFTPIRKGTPEYKLVREIFDSRK